MLVTSGTIRGSTTVVPAPTISVANQTGRGRGGLPFLRDAFRPFYLGGALFAALAVPLWLGMWRLGNITPSIPPLLWHTHEMVFGFGAAIIVGFLFTAARNWTGLPLPAGAPLALLFALWAGARAGMLLAYGPATALIDSALLVIVAGVLAQRFIRARSVGSMPLVVVLLLLALANVTFHASMLGLAAVAPLTAVELGLMLVVLIEMIVGGRVVPAFTASGVPNVRQWRPKWLQRAAWLLAATTVFADAVHLPGSVVGPLFLVTGAFVAILAAGWNPLAARLRPMLWVLHLAYAWIPVGFVLLGLASLGMAPRSAGIHALAVGSMGGLVIGMITRTALGHSGRQVNAGPWELVAFVLVHAAAIIRIVASLLPALSLSGVTVSGIAWSAAFLVYAISYAPLLLGTRRPPVS